MLIWINGQERTTGHFERLYDQAGLETEDHVRLARRTFAHGGRAQVIPPGKARLASFVWLALSGKDFAWKSWEAGGMISDQIR